MGAAVKRIDVQHQFVVTRFHQSAGTALISCATHAHFGFTHHATFGTKDAFTRDAVVDHIHHTADGTAAVQQSGRTTQHFNPLGGKRIDRNGVVIAEARHIHVGTTVLQDAYAVTFHAANDGAAHIGTERAVGNARQVVQRFAQGAALALGERCT